MRHAMLLLAAGCGSLLIGGSGLAGPVQFSKTYHRVWMHDVDPDQPVVMCRLFMEMSEPDDELIILSGNMQQPVDVSSTGGFYQHPLGSDVEHDRNLHELVPCLEMDSYLSIGAYYTAPGQPPTSAPGVSGNFGTDLYLTNGAWNRLPGDPLTQPVDGRVFIGQFTMPIEGTFEGIMRVHDGASTAYMYFWFPLEGKDNLVPLVCQCDVNRDLVIDVDDFISVITRWGPCPACCFPDVTLDQEVNVDDLIEVILAWAPVDTSCVVGF